jgi:hypothetical protein
MAHTPTSGQLSKLATLQATVATATTTLAAAHVTLNSAAKSLQAAQDAAKQYETYIYGNSAMPGTVDGGSKDNT